MYISYDISSGWPRDHSSSLWARAAAASGAYCGSSSSTRAINSFFSVQPLQSSPQLDKIFFSSFTFIFLKLAFTKSICFSEITRRNKSQSVACYLLLIRKLMYRITADGHYDKIWWFQSRNSFHAVETTRNTGPPMPSLYHVYNSVVTNSLVFWPWPCQNDCKQIKGRFIWQVCRTVQWMAVNK